ncbi:MAG: FAD-dependent tricarballylate dehydrogenase TcuA [Dehalococcoidia bacterium]|nr:FAD-dependent tricarballylate dehydrogenase TcuA [Dehalococcoidia bacterium]
MLIVGGGNAALCAAIEARRAGASVLLLEAAPQDFRGGNSRHTRNVRQMHIGNDNFLVDDYTEEEFYKDLLGVTGGETDETLARLTIRSSEDLGTWMKTAGVRWQPPLRGTLQLSRTNAFFLGGGKALLNAYYRTAEKLGVVCEYDSPVEEIELDGDRIASVYSHGETGEEVRSKAIVVASGGFEANLDWMAEYWGEAAHNFAIRGTPYNLGRPLRCLLDAGARAIGNPKEFHAVAVDARGPQFDGGIVTRLDSVPLGIVVNKFGQRFYDEGEDFWPKRYATWGGLIARQPDQIAYSIVDAKVMDEFIPSLYPPIRADSIREIAGVFGLEPEVLETTVSEFNEAVVEGDFDLTKLDDCGTKDITPPKSHWAQKIETAPFFAYPLRPGITFTYRGVAVDEQARVQAEAGGALTGVFAAGEVMAGSILGRGYLAGFGMTIGAVFGRIAGREAAKHALG